MRALPYLLPYVLLVGAQMAALELFPEHASRVWPLLALALTVVLVAFHRRGAYPELRVRETPARGATWLAVAAGLLSGLTWVPLTDVAPALDILGDGGGRGHFDAAALGTQLTWLVVGSRLVTSIVLVPFAEELLVRSFVPRLADAGRTDWWELPVGRFSKLSFCVSVAFFTLTHPEWLAALVTGLLFTLLLMHTRRFRDVVIAHVLANAVLDGYVLLSGETRFW